MQRPPRAFLAALQQFGINVGDEDALDRLSASVTGTSQAIAGVVYPTSTDEVQAVVRLANEHDVALYPISRGLNWGYGSGNPPVRDSVVVDLSRMSRIRNADEIGRAHPVAVVEPGVTQQALFDVLEERKTGLTFNVSGAGAGTSILGNALDRGVGYFGPRREDLFGLEVVTGAGEVINTGFRRLGEDSPLAHLHPYGIGPMLDGLFFQGNYGIVTSACFRLEPKRPFNVAISLALKDCRSLAQFIDVLAELKREHIMSTVTHLANKERANSSMFHGASSYLADRCEMPVQEADAEAQQFLDEMVGARWSSLSGVTGNFVGVLANLMEVYRRTRRFASIRIVSEGLLSTAFAIVDRFPKWRWARKNAAVISAMMPLHSLSLGRPTDVPIQNLLYRFDAPDSARPEELDQSNCGLIFVNPAFPMNGEFVVRVLADLQAVADEHDLPLYTTLNFEGQLTMVGVINLLFDKSDPAAVTNAHRCADRLLEVIVRHGLSPYRARADMMDELVDEQDVYWRHVYALKEILDPNDVIAPGRYNLTRRQPPERLLNEASSG